MKIQIHAELGDALYDSGGESDTEEEDVLVNTKQRVDQVMDSLQTTADDITVTPLSTDTAEYQLVTQFMASGCGCSKVQGRPCYQQFSQEHVASVRALCTQLSHAELDMAILGQLQASLNTSSAVSIQAQHKETEPQKSYASFSHQGMPMCSKMFRFLHGIGETRLKSLS